MVSRASRTPCARAEQQVLVIELETGEAAPGAPYRYLVMPGHLADLVLTRDASARERKS